MHAILVVIKTFVPFGRVGRFKGLPFQGFHGRIVLVQICPCTFASKQTSSMVDVDDALEEEIKRLVDTVDVDSGRKDRAGRENAV